MSLTQPTGTTVRALLVASAQKFGAREAIRFPGKTLTFIEVAERASKVSAALSQRGIRPGDHVGILVPDGPEGMTTLLGILWLGAVAVPINGRYKTDELDFILKHADLRAVVCDDVPDERFGYRRLLQSVVRAGQGRGPFPGYPDLQFIAGLGDGQPGDIDLSIDGLPPNAAALTDASAVALILYTSGTTARPKGCMHSHAALTRHAPNALGSILGVTEADRIFAPLPMFHAGGIVSLLGCLSLGATFCHSGRFEVESAIAFLKDERCTVAYAPFEAIWGTICSRLEVRPESFPALRTAVYCVPYERMAQAQRAIPNARLVGAYGSTESCINLTMASPGDTETRRLSTVGRVVEGMEVRIVDPDTLQPVPVGVRGELTFRGYSRFLGYYKAPELEAEVIDAQDWFHSGDLASVDEEGLITFGGRLKDMLKVGGENVAAIEIEDFLARHEAISVVHVTGVPDELYGEVPAAFIQLHEGASLSESDVRAFCIGRIATFKVPRYVRMVTSWPMSGTKVKKFELRSGLIAELERAGIRSAPKISTLQ